MILCTSAKHATKAFTSRVNYQCIEENTSQTKAKFVSMRNVGKRFKRSSELKAHLKTHTGKAIKCDHCMYTNRDIRNVRHMLVFTLMFEILFVRNVGKDLSGAVKRNDT